MRDSRTDKKQINSVRLLISYEIDAGLLSLDDYWTKVQLPTSPTFNNSESIRKAAKEIISRPPPHITRKFLDSNLVNLVSALSESEIKAVLEYYERIARFLIIYESLSTSWNTQQIEARAAVIPEKSSAFAGAVLAYFPPKPFDDKAQSGWEESKTLISKILEAGNPLANKITHNVQG